MLFLWYPRCGTCQKAKRWLDENGIAYEARDIRLQNPSAEELRDWSARGGQALKRFFNASGTRYRELGLRDRLPGMTEDAQYVLLATDGMLVKRPLLVGEDFVLAGFRPDEWARRLGI